MNRNKKAAQRKRAREERRLQARRVDAGARLSPLRIPTDEEKAAICGAVRRAVFDDIAEDELAGTACVYINGVACGVLAALTPHSRICWRLRAGSASVASGAYDDEGALAVGYDFDSALAEGLERELHAWVVGDIGSEMHAVDFTIADFELTAQRSGQPWARTAPKYVWGNAEELQREGVWLSSHPLATREVDAVRTEQADWLARMTERALEACAARGITRLYELLSTRRGGS